MFEKNQVLAYLHHSTAWKPFRESAVLGNIGGGVLQAESYRLQVQTHVKA